MRGENQAWAIAAEELVLLAFVPLGMFLDRLMPTPVVSPRAMAAFVVLVPWVVALATPIVATVLDGRTHTAKWLVATAWGGLLLNVLFSATTPERRYGDGLVQFFAFWFTLIGGGGYLALVVIAFALTRRFGRHVER